MKIWNLTFRYPKMQCATDIFPILSFVIERFDEKFNSIMVVLLATFTFEKKIFTSWATYSFFTKMQLMFNWQKTCKYSMFFLSIFIQLLDEFLKMNLFRDLFCFFYEFTVKACIFQEGQKNWWNLHRQFDTSYIMSIFVAIIFESIFNFFKLY